MIRNNVDVAKREDLTRHDIKTQEHEQRLAHTEGRSDHPHFSASRRREVIVACIAVFLIVLWLISIIY